MDTSLDETGSGDRVDEIFTHMKSALQDLATEISREMKDLKGGESLRERKFVSVETEAGGYRYILTVLSAGEKTGLTKREAEIADLVARGLPNRAIAEHLMIARPTVAVHLRSIYRKWSVRSRTQLARRFLVGGTSRN